MSVDVASYRAQGSAQIRPLARLPSADSTIASVTRCRASLLLESISNALPALRDTRVPTRDIAAAARETQQCVALLFARVDGGAQVLRFTALRLHHHGCGDAHLRRRGLLFCRTRARSAQIAVTRSARAFSSAVSGGGSAGDGSFRLCGRAIAMVVAAGGCGRLTQTGAAGATATRGEVRATRTLRAGDAAGNDVDDDAGDAAATAHRRRGRRLSRGSSDFGSRTH